MKVNKLLFANKDYVFEGEISFEDASVDPNHIRKILPASFKITGQVFEDLLLLHLDIKTTVIGVCCYTLEDVELPIHIVDDIQISDTIEDDDHIFYEPNVLFDIDPYILSLIIASVPIKIVKKGAKLPNSGEGYRVLSEEEYLKEEASKKDPRWAALDDIELD